MFDHDGATAEIVRDDAEYTGVRVSMTCQLATARISYHVDVNVGDPIFPGPQDILVPRLLGGDSIALRGYPITMVHAEKIVTAVARGTANTRWRDFGDVYVLAGQHPIRGGELISALDGVAEHRVVDVQPLKTVLEGYAALAQSKYAAWRRKNARDELPDDFGELLANVIEFADPALTHEAAGLTWDPIARAWA